MIAEQQMGGIVPGYGVGNFKEQLDDKSLTVKRKRGGEHDDYAFQYNLNNVVRVRYELLEHLGYNHPYMTGI